METVRHQMVPFVSNAEVQWTSDQPLLTWTIKARHLYLGTLHDWMIDNADAKNILIAFQMEGTARIALRSHG